MSSLFDEYSLNARVRPALLALLPCIIFVYVTYTALYKLISGAISVIITCGFITALAHLSRTRGRTAEKKMFAVWGGKPTTIMLRHRDTHLDPVTKHRYHKFLEKHIEHWTAPSEEEESHDPIRADLAYDSAVKWLLEFTRNPKRYSMLFKENIGYGFRRNCYGIKWIAVFFAALPLVLTSIGFFNPNGSIAHIRTVSAAIYIAFSILLLCWWLFLVNEKWVRDAADAYAIRLLAACDNSESE